MTPNKVIYVAKDMYGKFGAWLSEEVDNPRMPQSTERFDTENYALSKAWEIFNEVGFVPGGIERLYKSDWEDTEAGEL